MTQIKQIQNTEYQNGCQARCMTSVPMYDVAAATRKVHFPDVSSHTIPSVCFDTPSASIPDYPCNPRNLWSSKIHG